MGLGPPQSEKELKGNAPINVMPHYPHSTGFGGEIVGVSSKHTAQEYTDTGWSVNLSGCSNPPSHPARTAVKSMQQCCFGLVIVLFLWSRLQLQQ